MFENNMKRLIAIVLIFGLTLMPCPGSLAEEKNNLKEVVDTTQEKAVYLTVGELISLKVYSLTRVAIGRPGVVEITNADVDEIVLVGREIGETPIFLWDEYGKRKISVHVASEDIDLLMDRMDALLQSGKIKNLVLSKNAAEGKIVISGTVYKSQKEQLREILKPFSNNVVNLWREQGELVQIDAQISELTTSLSSAFGFDWNTGADGMQLAYEEQQPSFTGDLGDWFKIGDFQRTTAILAVVSAYITEGKGRILSKPSIVVTSGEEAKFLVGGEIPVRTTSTSTGGSVTENINFVEYGVSLSVSPEINDDKIDVDLDVEVKDVDAANAVGDTVAFTNRKAKTRLLLNNGQTIVLAGLIKHNKGEQTKRVPFISAIPVIGALFRSKSITPNSEIELVISLTPRILGLEAAGGNDSPTQGATSPIEKSVQKDEIIEQSNETADPEKGAFEQSQNSLTSGDDKSLLAALPEKEALAETEAISATKATQPEAKPAEDIMKDENVSRAITQYVQDVQKKVASASSYPYEAQEKGWQGTVDVVLTILSDGSLNEVKIKKSSNYAVFDQDAVNTVKILAPYDPFPAEAQLDQMQVTVPIVYSPQELEDKL